jgi:biopolymer transport protein ExbD
MRSRRKVLKKAPDIPIASFSDLAFLLIIFFVLTASFNKARGFVSDLPSGQVAQQQDQRGEMPTVVIDPGAIRLNDTAVTMDELRKRLLGLNLGARTNAAARIVILESTAGVDYQSYFETMSAIANAKGIVAIVKEGGEKK